MFSKVCMRNLIYISGPITDNKTGLPRNGWENEFRAAEEKLLEMGFSVITPTCFAKGIEKEWDKRVADGLAHDSTPRWYYIHRCLDEIAAMLRVEDMLSPLIEKLGTFHLLGLYVIGDMADISMSYGTMCEINFAMAAGLPVWSQYYGGCQMTNMLMQKTYGQSIEEAAKQLKTNYRP